MTHVPILSICIPTNGNVKYVLNTIDSIYSQNIDKSLFEVVISDNGSGDELIKSIEKLGYDNLIYIKSKEHGYLNQKVCLLNSKGIFCKLHNHRCLFLPGSLEELIEFVQRYQYQKPVIFCSNGNLKGPNFIECSSLDNFIYNLTYYTSWSGGLCIWDIDRELISSIELDEMFPHASILFESRKSDATKYIINNIRCLKQIEDYQKGTYNLFNVFAVKYLDLIYDLYKRKRIKLRTFKQVKKSLLNQYLCGWYYSEVLCQPSFTFDMSDIKYSMSKYYSKCDYLYMIIKSVFLYTLRNICHIK